MVGWRARETTPRVRVGCRRRTAFRPSISAATILALVSKELCERHTVIPVSLTHTDDALVVAMADSGNASAIDDLKLHTGLNIAPVVAPATVIQEAIAKYYRA